MQPDLIDVPAPGNVIAFPRPYRPPPVPSGPAPTLSRPLHERAADAAVALIFALCAAWNAVLILASFGVRVF